MAAHQRILQSPWSDPLPFRKKDRANGMDEADRSQRIQRPLAAVLRVKERAAGLALPITLGFLGAGLFFPAIHLWPDAGFRLLAALVATPAWIYFWMAFESDSTIKTFLSIALAVGAWVLALWSLTGGLGILVAGFVLHSAWGGIRLSAGPGRNPDYNVLVAWVAFNVSLALALSFVLR